MALRPLRSRTWLVVARHAIPEQGLPLGLELALERPEAERRRDPQSGRAHVLLPLSVPSLPPAIAVAAAAVALILAAAAWLSAEPDNIGLAQTRDIAWAAAGAWLAWQTFVALQAALLRSSIRGPLWGLGWWGLRVETVAWRLRPSATTAPALLLLGTALSLLGWATIPHLPAFSLGWTTGVALATLMAALPLRSGPGARILGAATGIDDATRALYWLLVAHLFRLCPTSGNNRLAALLLAALAAWLAAAAAILDFIGDPAVAGATLAGVVWRGGVAVLSLLYGAVVTATATRLAWHAWRLATRAAPTPLSPASSMQRHLAEHSALMAHVPELAQEWFIWQRLDPGQRLITYAATDRSFYWLASGSARVVARSSKGLPIEVAILGPGVGVGELALLDGRPRTADVIVDDTTVVAELRAERLTSLSPEALARLRDVVAAGQSLARAPVFAALPAPDRERWLRYGRPLYVAANTAIVHEGDTEQWIGLIVRGRVAVERQRRLIAELGPDNVFGEIAYLGTGIRTATLRALEPVLIWRWATDWLDNELGHGDLRRALEALATARSGAA